MCVGVVTWRLDEMPAPGGVGVRWGGVGWVGVAWRLEEMPAPAGVGWGRRGGEEGFEEEMFAPAWCEGCGEG